jgi:hypothetical protein
VCLCVCVCVRACCICGLFLDEEACKTLVEPAEAYFILYLLNMLLSHLMEESISPLKFSVTTLLRFRLNRKMELNTRPKLTVSSLMVPTIKMRAGSNAL